MCLILLFFLSVDSFIQKPHIDLRWRVWLILVFFLMILTVSGSSVKQKEAMHKQHLQVV